MQGRKKNLFLLRIFSSSTFVCLYFLFFDHNHFSLSLRIDHEDNIRKAANKIINISRKSYHGSNGFDQLMFHILPNYSDVILEGKKDKKHFDILSLNGQTSLEGTSLRYKRGFHSLSNEDLSNPRLQRSSSSRQQKLGPIFYKEPPTIYYFSNDTGMYRISIVATLKWKSLLAYTKIQIE